MASRHLAARKTANLVMGALCCVGATLAIFLLGCVLYFLVVQGVHFINLSLFTNIPDAVDSGKGGMSQSILGTLTLLGIASVIGLPLGILGGIYQIEVRGWFAATVRFLTDVLNGVPSIVIGIFVYTIYVYPIAQHNPGQGYSAYAGGFALGIMMVPTIMRTTEEMLRLVPFSLREASLALGATRWRTMLSIVLPAARGGIVTGVMLALARIAGETAPLLFTILGNNFLMTHPVHLGPAMVNVPTLNAPTDALPLRIYNYATAPDDNQNHQAWAASLILIALVLVLSITARLTTRNAVRDE